MAQAGVAVMKIKRDARNRRWFLSGRGLDLFSSPLVSSSIGISQSTRAIEETCRVCVSCAGGTESPLGTPGPDPAGAQNS